MDVMADTMESMLETLTSLYGKMVKGKKDERT